MDYVLSGHWSGTSVCFVAAEPEQDPAAVFSEPLLGSSEISYFWLVQFLCLPIHQVTPEPWGGEAPGLSTGQGLSCCLPVSMWLRGFLPSPVSLCVDAVVQAAPCGGPCRGWVCTVLPVFRTGGVMSCLSALPPFQPTRKRSSEW